MVSKITLGEESKFEVRLDISELIESPPLYALMKKASSSKEKIAKALEALSFGSYALYLDTTSTLLNKVERELNGRLSELRLIYEVSKKEEASSAVGVIAELDFEEALRAISEEMGFGDVVRPTGTNSQDGLVRTAGDRKLGDLEILVADSGARIAVESKYTEGGPSMGDPTKKAKNASFTIEKHAKGQVLGAQLNRGASYAIYITKPGSDAASKITNGLKVDFEDMGIYVVADRSTGDYSNLKVAYLVARALTLSIVWPVVQQHHLRTVVNMLIRSLNKIASFKTKMDEVAKTGRDLTALAESILDEYAEELGTIAEVESYLTAVSQATVEEALALKIQQIKLLTGQTFEPK